MIRLGLSSASFLTSSPAEVIVLARELGFDAIEWAGDAHVPSGDPMAATAVLMDTLRAGLTVAAYAPLYRVTPEREQGIGFEDILAAAVGLHAPIVRVFAGSLPAARLEPAARTALVEAIRLLGDAAAAKGITVALAPGKRTSLDCQAAARGLVEETAHPFVRLAWEALPGDPPAEADAALDASPGGYALLYARRSDRAGRAAPLRGEAEAWKARLASFDAPPYEDALGRFVIAGRSGEVDPDRLRDDAAFLAGLIDAMEEEREAEREAEAEAARPAARAARQTARARRR